MLILVAMMFLDQNIRFDPPSVTRAQVAAPLDNPTSALRFFRAAAR